MINTPGYHNLSMSEYLADPCPQPSLSTGVVYDLLQRSPLHAHSGHPRLGGNLGEPTARGDLGSAIHSLVLGGHDVVYAPPEFADWRKKLAQEFRDEAREMKQIPLLDSQRRGVAVAVESAKLRLASFGDGIAEQSMLWQTEGSWCRGRADWLTADGRYDIDIKTCDNADPTDWLRTTVQRGGLDIQAGLRSLGHKALGCERKMLWLLVEIEAPYACSIIGLAPSMISLAERKCIHAAQVWSQCLKSEIWPGYSGQIFWADVQSYAESDFAQRTGVAP